MIRTLKFNRRWAAKLEKQKAKRLAREQAKKEREAAAAKARQEQEERAKVNPFSAPTAGATGGLGGMLFGGGAENPFAPSTAAPASAAAAPSEEADAEAEESDEEDDSEDEEESESERLAEELALKSDLASTTPSPASTWVESSTRYPALYLNTVPEPSSSSISKKLSKEEAAMLKSASASGALATEGGDDSELKGFAKEGYEKMLLDGIDDTFERFLKRVQVEPRQAVRYEFGGEPIAFHAKGKVYDLLWPKEKKVKAGEGVSVTKGQFKAGEVGQGERRFSASGVPPCPDCGSERVFEAQLMPNLINLLKAETIQAADGTLDTSASSAVEEEAQDDDVKRKTVIEQALGRRLPNANQDPVKTCHLDARTGLVWSTAFVFTCKQDCCAPNGTQSLPAHDECWKEEFILAQFEDEQ